MSQKFMNPFEVFDARLTEIQSMLIELIHKPTSPPPSEPIAERYITPKETMHILGDISSPTLWDWDKKGITKPYRLGNTKRYKLSEVLACPRAIHRTKK